MRHYRLSGVEISSEFELSRARPSQRPTDVDVLRVILRDPAPPAVIDDWLDERCVLGAARPWLSVARAGSGFLLRAHAVGDFEVDERGATIACVPRPGIALDVLEQGLVDQVLPQVLHLRGRFAFHASALTTRAGAVGFLGVSGMGKSTLVAGLSRKASCDDLFTSCTLVSDDCLAFSEVEGGIVVHPSYAAARLWPDALEGLGGGASCLDSRRTGKRRVDREAVAGAVPLVALYVLAPRDAGVTIDTLRGSEIVGALAANLHRLDHGDRTRLAEEFDLLNALARRVAVRRLAYPRRFSALGDVRAALVSDLEGLDAV